MIAIHHDANLTPGDKPMGEKIMTLHPQGLNGVRIERSKYEQVRRAIIQALRENSSLTFKELTRAVEQELTGQFDGSLGWYCTTVKLDLEARGEILCSRDGSRQQTIHMAGRSQEGAGN
jgi:hypothetical protein